jgi:hypothetical protein
MLFNKKASGSRINAAQPFLPSTQSQKAHHIHVMIVTALIVNGQTRAISRHAISPP